MLTHYINRITRHYFIDNMEVMMLKNHAIILLLSIAAALPSAPVQACRWCEIDLPQQVTPCALPDCYEEAPEEDDCASDYYDQLTYVKLGGAFLASGDTAELCPAIGIGKRYQWNEHAVDLSANFSGGENDHYYASLPKILYLHYLTPSADLSPYFGGGLSYGAMKANRRRFEGIFIEGAAGIEFQRQCPIRTFIQLDISYGAISASRRGSTPPPAILLTAGVGY